MLCRATDGIICSCQNIRKCYNTNYKYYASTCLTDQQGVQEA